MQPHVVVPRATRPTEAVAVGAFPSRAIVVAAPGARHLCCYAQNKKVVVQGTFVWPFQVVGGTPVGWRLWACRRLGSIWRPWPGLGVGDSIGVHEYLEIVVAIGGKGGVRFQIFTGPDARFNFKSVL